MDKTITYSDTRLHYTVEGVGRPLFLLHGWGCNGEIFNQIKPFLAESFQVITVDFAGFGKSEEPQSVWGVEEYTRSVEAIAEQEDITNPILIGHSFGGRVSILYASRNATRKVILVDAAGVKPRRSFTYYRKVYTYKLLKRLLPLLVGKQRAAKIIEERRAKSGSADYNNASPMMRAILSKCVNEDLCHLMPKIKAPTLLFWGENDTATPLADAKIIEGLIKDCGLCVIPDTGHWSFVENPVLAHAIIKSFLGVK